MPSLPSRPTKGRPVLDWAIAMHDYLAGQVSRGPGVKSGSGGTSFSSRPSASRSRSAVAALATLRSFAIRPAATATGASAIRITPGTLEGLVPASPSGATGFTLGDVTPNIVPVSTSGQVYFSLARSGTPPVLATPKIEIAATVPADSASMIYRALGSFTVENVDGEKVTTAATNFGFGPVNVSLCRDWASFPVAYSPTWNFLG